MWTFEQPTGKWFDPAGNYVSTGYSGNGEGLNNPAMQDVPSVGPLPLGEYDNSEWFTDPEEGELVCELIPRAGTNVFGRSGFRNHGDNQKGDHSASKGCAIADHATRLARSQSPDQALQCVLTFQKV